MQCPADRTGGHSIRLPKGRGNSCFGLGFRGLFYAAPRALAALAQWAILQLVLYSAYI
jgi:hypothetical protein